MKVKIGPYNNWFGPYQLAEALCFWVPKQKGELGLPKTADWVHKFGEFLAHGSIEPERKVGDTGPLFKDRPETFIYKFLKWIESKKKRKVKIHIDKWDTWNMHNTLSMIIVPMLKQLKESKHGAPFVDDKDVPKHLRSTEAPPKKDPYDIDENHFARWNWVLDEMIFAFECDNNDWEAQFYSGESCPFQTKKIDDNWNELIKDPDDTFKFDHKGHKKFYERITNGHRLFGKYYMGLWD